MISQESLFEHIKSLLARADLIRCDHARILLGRLVLAIVENFLASLLEEDLIFVPVLAELLVYLINWHVGDSLLRNVILIYDRVVGIGSAKVRLVVVNGGIVESDCKRAPRRHSLVEVVEITECVVLFLLQARHQARVHHFTDRGMLFDDNRLVLLAHASRARLCISLPIADLFATNSHILTLLLLAII